MLPLLFAALLGTCALMVVLAPIFAQHASATDPGADATGTLAERERAAKDALADVEFDHQLGNLADDDYQGLRERYTRRALAALKGRYDRERALDEAIEAQVRALRERSADSAPPARGDGTRERSAGMSSVRKDGERTARRRGRPGNANHNGHGRS